MVGNLQDKAIFLGKNFTYTLMGLKTHVLPFVVLGC
jgi:hypothetical protein